VKQIARLIQHNLSGLARFQAGAPPSGLEIGETGSLLHLGIHVPYGGGLGLTWRYDDPDIHQYPQAQLLY
jgi:hypothetical protein